MTKRPILRIVLFTLVYVLSYVLMGVGMVAGYTEGAIIVGSAIVITVLALLLVRASTSYLGGRSLSELGLSISTLDSREFVGGLFLGFAILSLTLLLGYSLGSISVPDSGLEIRTVSIAWVVILLIGFVCVSLYEEIIFRGVFIQNEIESLTNRGWSLEYAIAGAIVTSATVFALLHGLDVWTVLYSSTFGLLLGITFVLSGGLAMPIGIHTSANIFITIIYGFGSVRVGNNQVVLLNFDIATGGFTEPMRGPLVVSLLLGCAVIIGWYRRKGVSMENAVLRLNNKPGSGISSGESK